MSNYGILINQDAKLHRAYFKEMVKLIGVICLYKYPISGKNYTLHGEFDRCKFSDEMEVGCIFQEHEDQKTAKVLGWDNSLVDKASVIHVPYDLPGLQLGCLFDVPSAFDNSQARTFRVTKISASMIYPASLACEIVPEFTDTLSVSDVEDFKDSNFNLLREG